MSLEYKFSKPEDLHSEVVVEQPAKREARKQPGSLGSLQDLVAGNLKGSLGKDERKAALQAAIKQNLITNQQQAMTYLNVSRQTVQKYLKELHVELPKEE